MLYVKLRHYFVLSASGHFRFQKCTDCLQVISVTPVAILKNCTYLLNKCTHAFNVINIPL